MMMWIKPVFRVLAAGLLAQGLLMGTAQAADGAQAQLRKFIETVKTASGTFTQSQASADRQRPAQTGVFAFQRPGKFRWEVLKPYAQLTLSDGKQVYQYDPDLAQVTQRGLDASIGASPAGILFGTGKFDESFDVTALPDNDGLAWLRAQPRQGDAGFVHVDIGLRDGLPARLLLLDAFGQTSRIEFDAIQANPTLPQGMFRLDVPAGVDIVKMP